MPELPDIEVYLDALRKRVSGATLDKIRLASPFVLRTFEPNIREAEGKRVLGLRRLGKRIVFELEADLFLVVHLMVGGRFRWKDRGAKVPGKVGLGAFDFSTGTLILTEASKKKRASIHLLRGEAALDDHDPGGIELDRIDLAGFKEALTRENHTIKRTLTDPRVFAGIGNSYSDEILHRARLSPMKWTTKLTADEMARLFDATKAILAEWTERLRSETGDTFPEKVTAFREGMAVHGRYGEPCPVCGSKVQRIVRAENEFNYCATCQTDGRLLADRSLSKLLHDDWPKTLEELEELKRDRRG